MTRSEIGLRQLVACGECRRQFDVAGFATGSTFHCSCGRALKVPEFKPHDAAVVRCSSCGAPRESGRAACSHCAADFTAIEQDLNTICPSCMTVVGDRARFCHHCATPIVAQDVPAKPTTSRCPACGKRQRLNSRDFGDPPVAVLECPTCAGLWLAETTFRLIADGARAVAVDRVASSAVARPSSSRVDAGPSARGGRLYRRCPECDQMMHRFNFGRLSGVIIDSCREHGVWFDARELESVLAWIRDGGELAAQRREQDEQRSAERIKGVQYEWQAQGMPPDELSAWGGADDLVVLFRRIFNL